MNFRRVLLRLLVLLIVLAGVWFVAQGCHAWDGAGKDVERWGEKMQGEDDDDQS